MIVSITSHIPRFPKLHLTLRSLLTQSIRPDRIILWLAEADIPALPEAIRSLEREGLEIRACADLRSFKKIIPTISSFPSADVVTADDDVYYWANWLQELLLTADRFPGNAVAHRLHRMVCDGTRIRPYREWPKKIRDQSEHPRNFATGMGGVFYPAGCLHPDVANKDDFMRLCPDADDVWLFWMVRLNGRFEVHSGTLHEPIEWHGAREHGLWKTNKTRNDLQIAAMAKTYGLP